MASEQGYIDMLVNGRKSSSKRLIGGSAYKQLHRTYVNKAPEVMVKVSGGGKTTQHVQAHLDYITRNGKIEAINDQGEKINGKEGIREAFDAWDIDASGGQGKNRQAFNIVLSMPAGTSPDGLLDAAQAFARDEFYGQRQYMMVLHTPDTDPNKNAPDHPHVHLVVKAEGLDGQRLHIRKATLEQWRESFAEKLRERGIEANATRRAVRGKTRRGKKVGVLATEKRGQSRVLKEKFKEAREELIGNSNKPRPWEKAIENRRRSTIRQLYGAAAEVEKDMPELAKGLREFAKNLPAEAEKTEMQAIKEAIVKQVHLRRVQDKAQSLDQER